MITLIILTADKALGALYIYKATKSIPYSVFHFAPIIPDKEIWEAFPWKKANLQGLQECN